VSLFDGLQLLTPPRFARWRQQKALIFNPGFVGFELCASWCRAPKAQRENVVSSSRRVVVFLREAHRGLVSA
jgi:hypothetical protein